MHLKFKEIHDSVFEKSDRVSPAVTNPFSKYISKKIPFKCILQLVSDASLFHIP